MLLKQTLILVRLFLFNSQKISNIIQIYNNRFFYLFNLLPFKTYLSKYLINIKYFINFKVANNFLLNSCVTYILLLLQNMVLNFKISFNFIKSFTTNYTLMRSPFIHKTSRDQLVIKYLVVKLLIKLNIIINNDTYINYVDWFILQFVVKFNSINVKHFKRKINLV